MKIISPEIRLKIINLSKCFWFWGSFYSFYAQILGISKRELEIKFPKNSYNKYSATEVILEELDRIGNHDKLKEIVAEFYRLKEPFDKQDNPKFKDAKQELIEFRNLVGKDVIAEQIEKNKFEKELVERKKEDLLEKVKKQKLEEIRNEFLQFSLENDQKKKAAKGILVRISIL